MHTLMTLHTLMTDTIPLIPMAGKGIFDEAKDQGNQFIDTVKILFSAAVIVVIIVKAFKSGMALGTILMAAFGAALIYWFAFAGGVEFVGDAFKQQVG